MLHRLRRAMIRPGRERLGGLVEVDESIVGRSLSAKPHNKRKKKSKPRQLLTSRSVIAVAVEIKEPKGNHRPAAKFACGGVVHHQPEAGSERAWLATRLGPG